MTERSLASNPFAALFPTIQEAQKFRDEIEEHKEVLFGPCASCSSSKFKEDPTMSNVVSNQEALLEARKEHNAIIEDIFLITADKSLTTKPTRPVRLIYLRDLPEVMGERKWLDLDFLEEAVFERLMLERPNESSIVTTAGVDDSKAQEEASEVHNLRYLYMCFYRCKKKIEILKGTFERITYACQNVIITNSRMVLCHPEIYEGQETAQQFLDLFLEITTTSAHQDRVIQFLEYVFKDIETANHSGEEEIPIAEACVPILDLLVEKFKVLSIGDTSLFTHLPIVHFFTRLPCLAKVFLTHSTPRTMTLGKSYEVTLLGSIIRISCLPRSELGPFEFFDQPSQFSQQEHSLTERSLWAPIGSLIVELHTLFNRLLRVSPEVKHMFLHWLGNCFQSNAGRARLWTHVQNMLTTDVSDAFMLNLGNVLLKLCKPFSEPLCPKLLKIDPTYCAAIASSEEEVKMRGIYLRDIHRETCLINMAQGEHARSSANFSFSTICFFMTHRCLCLGFNTVHEKFLRLNQELARVQRLYEDARTQGGENSEMVQSIKSSMERGMSHFLCTKAALLEPNSLELMLNFYIATSTWLTHLATITDISASSFQPVQFPLPACVVNSLACIPEFIVDGIADFTIFLRRFSAKTLEMCGEHLEHLMTFILVFMGSHDRIKNPHLRAKLAEMLEALMPHNDSRMYSSFVNVYHRERLFKEHANIKELVPTLLKVFVSIEMTGQSVSFEQKFNYRRPMYIVMDYIWGIDLHRNSFKALADDAENKMEDTIPPLFLRFVNLLINDAIFLLDEALTYMTRLREQQQLREAGQLQELTAEQRQQNEANFQHMGMLARFHNVMGNSTIHVLELLTQDIASVFIHPTMVDRIAAMLNFFLLHLVGPKNKQLKVKDLAEYEFKPQELVRDICGIYLHLGGSKAFCQAVSRDGRSYSHDLFLQAEEVLTKIGQMSMVTELREVAATIKDLAAKQAAEEEALGDAPEDFLDPIMGTLMNDPVLLPSSHVVVDRATISRHLLSDQTDPFNRSALTMDMVTSETDLKSRIQTWLSSKHSKSKSNQGSLQQLNQPSTSYQSK